MKKDSHINYYGEKWKNVNFPTEHSNKYRLEVSNLGRIRSFNKLSNGNILNGSITEGYKIIRLKFFKPANPADLKKAELLLKKITNASKKIKLLTENGENITIVKNVELDLKKIKTIYTKHLAQSVKERTIHYHSLIHRLVAEYFISTRSLNKTIVAHVDFDKLNNNVKNLKWMTPQENYAHQKNSPFVIEEKKRRIIFGPTSSNKIKLTVTKVMLLKKMLNEGRKTVKQLAKQFKVSDMQIIRIRRGENWSAVPAAQ